MRKERRPKQKEFREDVLKLHKKKFDGFIFCRVCPINHVGFDRDGKEIPLEAHHAAEPYAMRHSQDPEVGAIVCRASHRYHIHTSDGGITRSGVRLMRLFNQDSNVERYDIGVRCAYKDKNESKD